MAARIFSLDLRSIKLWIDLKAWPWCTEARTWTSGASIAKDGIALSQGEGSLYNLLEIMNTLYMRARSSCHEVCLFFDSSVIIEPKQLNVLRTNVADVSNLLPGRQNASRS